MWRNISKYLSENVSIDASSSIRLVQLKAARTERIAFRCVDRKLEKTGKESSSVGREYRKSRLYTEATIPQIFKTWAIS